MQQNNLMGLTLGGGAAKGISILGIIEEIEKLDLNIGYISGTSIGAIIGAYYALYGEVSSLKKEIFSLKKIDILRFADFNKLPHKSLIKADHYKKFLRKIFEDKEFSDTKIPLIITTTNLTNGEIVYIEKGNIFDALIASSAYPGIFPPYVDNKNEVYVDGGVLDNLPYNILLKKGLTKIIVVNLYLHSRNKKNKNLLSVISNSIDLMMGTAYHGLEIKDKRLFFIQPNFKKSFGSIWDFSDLKIKYLVGVTEFQKRKKELLNWLNT